jgi:hypothetical protein
MATRGGSKGGEGAHPARAPPKIGKNMIFWRKIVIFHTKYPFIVELVECLTITVKLSFHMIIFNQK